MELAANEYQHRAFEFARPECRNLNYMILGLCSEAGEVAGKHKKDIRGDTPQCNSRYPIVHELADVLWYLSGVAQVCGYTLTDLMAMNLEKLADRDKRGVITGSGDLR